MIEHERLPKDLVAIGVWVGKQRYGFAVEKQCDPGDGPSKQWNGPGNHIQGALSEIAASLRLNVSWQPNVGQLHRPDIAGFIEVRSTTKRNGVLTIKEKDRGPFVLVIVRSEYDYDFPGWYMAEDAKKDFPLDKDHGDRAHRVPQSALRPLDELRVIIAKHEEGRARFRLRSSTEEDDDGLLDVAAAVRDRGAGDPAAAGRPGDPAEGMART